MKTFKGNKPVLLRLPDEEKAILERLAITFNCTYGGKPSLGHLLRAIANQDLLLIPNNFEKTLDK
jgi:hypothetical protein